ncbi:DUF6461 domain-containing protein [Streptomyces flavofungini]|uniref:Uncharacterized protein n=1 Tax=Streptomyces flavofungini TaxID=68200 RepID=A0ABS0XBP0_9ACTN|nr:DUF6461 domain-containing protein [Streptomyces flavofungini]MBJ3810564.1 hypothetical protein [Streptomyces flavofungini]GHC83920.1 hypothetical protein GCM10010349_68530 [Streptomyces flavofungini]
MNRETTENGLSWIADAYDLGFTLTLSEGLSPHELLRAIGAEERHMVPLSRDAASELLGRDEEDHISDLDFLDWEDETTVARLASAGFLPVPPESIVRAGSVAGWAYALEEISCHTGDYIGALSTRGRAVCVHRNQNFSRVEFALRGELVSSFEPGLPHLANGVPAEVALGFVHDSDEVGEVAFLQFLEGEFGICLPWEETEAELLAAAFG